MNKHSVSIDFRASHALAALVCALMLGCSASSEAPPPYSSNGGAPATGGSNKPIVVPCTDGTHRSCSVVTYLASGVKSCWKGEQSCDDGVWGDCEELAEPYGSAGAGTAEP